MVCADQGVQYINMLGATSADNKEKWKKIKQTVREQYLVMLYFNGLNQNAYGDLHKEIHKAHQISRVNSSSASTIKRTGKIQTLQRCQAQGLVRCQEWHASKPVTWRSTTRGSMG